MNAQQINERLHKAKADKIKVYPCNNLREIGRAHV